MDEELFLQESAVFVSSMPDFLDYVGDDIVSRDINLDREKVKPFTLNLQLSDTPILLKRTNSYTELTGLGILDAVPDIGKSADVKQFFEAVCAFKV